MNAQPTRDEIERKMLTAAELEDERSQFPGMTYEQGVAEALRWVLGMAQDPLSN
ncbi:MAG TPA: hypothetical protein VFN09_06630 [Rhodanobacteraceae bacterium]|nr:hypothetical protein [Rhodanobacteraceae bacterium]